MSEDILPRSTQSTAGHWPAWSFTEEEKMNSRSLLRVTPWLIILVGSLIFLLAGCAGLVQKGGELLDGSATEEKTIALYRSFSGKETTEIRTLRHKDGTECIEISGSTWPGLALRGSMPAGDGTFELVEARILSTHVHGWNEFTLDLLGSAHFSVSGNIVGRLRIAGEVERVQISSGRIRLKSNRLTGTTALGSLRNRRERILALTEWMQMYQTGLQDRKVFADQKEFKDYWQGRLFPELVPKKKRPPEYNAKNAEWSRAGDVKWNLDYTKYLFPEELWELRNSGALLRDWEEAVSWIYIEYNWDNINGLLDRMIFRKIK